MDIKDLRGLVEAYQQINAPQEETEIDEALTGERYKKVMKKPGGTSYSRKVSEDPSKRATRGGRGGESDFGAGDRGSGNKAARRAAALKNEELDIFDVVLEFLQAEGYAKTLEEAEWMMANMIDEEAIGIILGESALGTMAVLGGMAAGRAIHGKLQARKAKKELEGKRRTSDYLGMKSRTKNVVARDRRASGDTRNEEYVDEAQHARENPEKYEREQEKKSAPVRGERTPMPPRGDKRREEFEKWYAKQMGR